MRYDLIYQSLMERAKHRQVEGYVEKHHIVPRCMGGTNDGDNIVKLTPEEHYLAHQLLVKMHPGHRGLLCAVIFSSQNNANHRSKVYGWIKRQLSANMTGRTTQPHSEETRAKISAAQKGKPRQKHSEETREKMSVIQSIRPRKPFTPEARERMRIAAINRADRRKDLP